MNATKREIIMEAIQTQNSQYFDSFANQGDNSDSFNQTTLERYKALLVEHYKQVHHTDTAH
jgi:hypothetical protein